MESKESQIDLSKVKPVESAGVDLSKYHKKTVKLITPIVLQVPSKYTAKIGDTDQHHFQWVLKVQSEVLETLKREGQDDIKFRASELFNLIQDKDGKLIGFPTGEGSNLMKFMNDLKISEPEKFQSLEGVLKAIEGKETLIKSYEKGEDDNKKTFLKFLY